MRSRRQVQGDCFSNNRRSIRSSRRSIRILLQPRNNSRGLQDKLPSIHGLSFASQQLAGVDLAGIALEALGCIHHNLAEGNLAEGSHRHSFAEDIEDPDCSSLGLPF